MKEQLTAVRDDLRARRAARAQHEALRRELASYRTSRDVDDLLGVIADQDGPEAEEIRSILLDNLRPSPEQMRVA